MGDKCEFCQERIAHYLLVSLMDPSFEVLSTNEEYPGTFLRGPRLIGASDWILLASCLE